MMKKAVIGVFILLNVVTGAVSQNECPPKDIDFWVVLVSEEVLNCTAEQQCTFANICRCDGGDYRVFNESYCGCSPTSFRDYYCEDINYKSPYTDSCDYGPGERCGDQCNLAYKDCSCGGEEFNVRESQTFCCNGKQHSINQPCESPNAPSACYNSYQDSEYIGYNAHFSCPDVCAPLLDMCQGISWCSEDVEVCDENLRIPRAFTHTTYRQTNSYGTHKYYNIPIQVEKLYLSHVNHHYYSHNAELKINDRKYDVFDRSDEEKIKEDIGDSLDFSELKFCLVSEYEGNTMGVQLSGCISKSEFCNDKSCDNIDFWVGNLKFWLTKTL